MVPTLRCSRGHRGWGHCASDPLIWEVMKASKLFVLKLNEEGEQRGVFLGLCRGPSLSQQHGVTGKPAASHRESSPTSPAMA